MSSNDEISDLKRTISESQDRLNKLVKTKEEEKEDRFRSEVNQNAEDLKQIKKELGELDSNYDPTQLAKSKEKLDIIVGICYLHDYEDDPYGRFAIGPQDSHEVNINSSLMNTKVKKVSEKYREEVNNRIMYLLIKYKWKRV